MIQLAAIAGVTAACAGVVALTARDPRLVAAGMVLAMVASPLAAAPEPTSLTIAFRIVGALLAGYLLWVAARSQGIASEGSGAGILAELAAAAAAFAVGWFVAPVNPLAGPLAAQAAGFSLVALAVAPITGRNVLRVGMALAMLTIGVSLLLQAWLGPASGLEQIALTALMVGVVGATSVLISPFVPQPAMATPRPTDLEAAQMAGTVGEQAAPPSEPTPQPARDRLLPGIDRGPAPVRVTRVASPRALRQAAPRASAGSGPVIGEIPPASTPQIPEVPSETTVRRLRPREPRR